MEHVPDKQRANDTLYVGPCWDFDLAFENNNRTYPISHLNDYIYRTNGSTTGYLKTLVNKIVVEDTQAKQQLLAIWSQVRKAGFTEESFIRYIDEQEALLQQSQRLNFIRWTILNQRVHQNPKTYGSYAKEVENVRNYIRYRISWMDEKLGFDASSLDGYVTPAEPEPAEKILRDGQLIILRNGKEYMVTGLQIR